MAENKKKRRSQSAEIAHRFSKNVGALIGMLFILFLVVMALISPLIYDYETDIIGQDLSQRFIKPCWKHPFGTDNMGRDLFARMVWGSRSSLPVGFLSVLIASVAGTCLGAIAGYYGGVVDSVIMRITDVFASIPNIMLAIALVAVMGASTTSLILAVGICSIPTFSRVTRASVMTVGGQEFVEAAKAIGLTSREIIFEQILPNCLSPVIVQVSLKMGSAIIIASGMSYIGLGVPAPKPEWGSLLSAGRQYIRDHGYLTVFPGLVIMATVIAFNMIGDGLRDAMDPKLKK